MVMLPQAPAKKPIAAVPQNNEADEVAQRALRLASGDLLDVSDLKDDRPDSAATGSSRGPWIKGADVGTPRSVAGSVRSATGSVRSTGSRGSARSVRPRTTETRAGRKRALQPQRPATSQTDRSRPRDRLQRLAAEKAALTERVTKRRPDGSIVRRDNVSQWIGVASDTAGVVERVYVPVPRQRISYRAARKKEIDDDIQFGANMRRQRMDRQRKIELEMYQRAFGMIDIDGNGTGAYTRAPPTTSLPGTLLRGCLCFQSSRRRSCGCCARWAVTQPAPSSGRRSMRWMRTALRNWTSKSSRMLWTRCRARPGSSAMASAIS